MSAEMTQRAEAYIREAIELATPHGADVVYGTGLAIFLGGTVLALDHPDEARQVHNELMHILAQMAEHPDFNPEREGSSPSAPSRAPAQITYEQAWESDPERALIALDALKVNRASLAAEARINRRLARQRRGTARQSLNAHRRGRLREEARAAHLAYCFLRGRAYHEVEGATTRKTVPRRAIERKLARIGATVGKQLASWLPEQ